MPETTIKYVRDKRSPKPLNETVSKYMRSNKGKNTKPEVTFRKALRAEGIRGYRLHWKKAPGKPDIAFPKRKIAVFVNGCYWHRCPKCALKLPKHNRGFWEAKFNRNVKRDQEKIQSLKQENWRVLVIWECDLKKNLNEQLLLVQDLICDEVSC